MSLEDIRKKIIADAEKKKAELLSITQQDADKIIQAGKENARIYKEEHERNIQNIAGNLERGLVIDARRTVANKILEQKRFRIKQVYAKAKDEFLSSADYPEIMKKLVLQSVETKKEIVIVGKNEKKLDDQWLESVNKSCSGQLTFSKESGDFEGGVLLKEKDSFVNITADTLFALIREKTEKPVADLLFVR